MNRLIRIALAFLVVVVVLGALRVDAAGQGCIGTSCPAYIRVDDLEPVDIAAYRVSLEKRYDISIGQFGTKYIPNWDDPVQWSDLPLYWTLGQLRDIDSVLSEVSPDISSHLAIFAMESSGGWGGSSGINIGVLTGADDFRDTLFHELSHVWQDRESVSFEEGIRLARKYGFKGVFGLAIQDPQAYGRGYSIVYAGSNSVYESMERTPIRADYAFIDWGEFFSVLTAQIAQPNFYGVSATETRSFMPDLYDFIIREFFNGKDPNGITVPLYLGCRLSRYAM